MAPELAGALAAIVCFLSLEFATTSLTRCFLFSRQSRSPVTLSRRRGRSAVRFRDLYYCWGNPKAFWEVTTDMRAMLQLSGYVPMERGFKIRRLTDRVRVMHIFTMVKSTSSKCKNGTTSTRLWETTYRMTMPQRWRTGQHSTPSSTILTTSLDRLPALWLVSS